MTSKLIILFAAMTIQFNVFSQLSPKIGNELCKQLHQNPELSLQEFETSKQMAAELRKAGFEVTETDKDALPIKEKTVLIFQALKLQKTMMAMKLR